jgi:hypothetical protein
MPIHKRHNFLGRLVALEIGDAHRLPMPRSACASPQVIRLDSSGFILFTVRAAEGAPSASMDGSALMLGLTKSAVSRRFVAPRRACTSTWLPWREAVDHVARHGALPRPIYRKATSLLP